MIQTMIIKNPQFPSPLGPLQSRVPSRLGLALTVLNNNGSSRRRSGLGELRIRNSEALTGISPQLVSYIFVVLVVDDSICFLRREVRLGGRRLNELLLPMVVVKGCGSRKSRFDGNVLRFGRERELCPARVSRSGKRRPMPTLREVACRPDLNEASAGSSSMILGTFLAEALSSWRRRRTGGQRATTVGETQHRSGAAAGGGESVGGGVRRRPAEQRRGSRRPAEKLHHLRRDHHRSPLPPIPNSHFTVEGTCCALFVWLLEDETKKLNSFIVEKEEDSVIKWKELQRWGCRGQGLEKKS
ncbi:hypothetical protein LINPERPRIM_LOCUS36516 [Linum perenne]